MRPALVIGLLSLFVLPTGPVMASPKAHKKGPPPLVFPAGAVIEPMVTLTTDRDSDVYYLSIILVEGKPAGMFVKPGPRNKPDPKANPNGRVFLLAEIERKQGVSLFELDGRDVLLMQGSLKRDGLEGRFRLHYLSNGLSMSYRSCDFDLRVSEEKYWVQNVHTKQRVSSVLLDTHWLGVSTLRGICRAPTRAR